MTTLHPRADRERTGGRPLRQCGAHTAIRMAPFNMAGVAGLLATCAAVAASAAHLLPLLLLLICPRGTQADQGKRSFVRFSLPSFTLPSSVYVLTYSANQAEMIVHGDTSGRDISRQLPLSDIYLARCIGLGRIEALTAAA